MPAKKCRETFIAWLVLVMVTDTLIQAYAAHVYLKERSQRGRKRTDDEPVKVLARIHRMKGGDNSDQNGHEDTRLGNEPVVMHCPECGQDIQTLTWNVCDRSAFFSCLSLALMGMCFIAWVPFVLDRFQRVSMCKAPFTIASVVR